MNATSREAFTIAAHVGEFDWTDEAPRHDLPGGWSFLGAGGDRVSYLSPTKVVYKIARKYRRIANEREFDFIALNRQINDLPPNFKIPAAKLYYYGNIPIIAMEYIEGTQYNCRLSDCCNNQQGCKFLDDIGYMIKLDDIVRSNVIETPAGIYYIIDFGEYDEEF